jgi:thiamine pyridinylase
MRPRIWPLLIKFLCPTLAMFLTGCSVICVDDDDAGQRELTVALYPFIPEFATAANVIKKEFEAANPRIALNILDLRSNYYRPDEANSIETVDADVFELDSILLAQFIASKKIRELPADALLPKEELLNNAYFGTQVDGKRYGAAHWICHNFLFFSKSAAPAAPIRTLTDLEKFIGPGNGPNRLILDLKGNLTLGGFYLDAAFDRYSDLRRVLQAVGSMDPALQDDMIRLLKLCPPGGCRDVVFHEDTGIYGQLFARKNSKALIGYSELLHDVIAETQACGNACISDADLDVSDLPLDDAGSTPITWVDSFTVNSRCIGQCLADASTFINFMNQDSTYLQLLLPKGTESLKEPTPTPVIPSYLLPAKEALYSNSSLLQYAHLYPQLRALVENSIVPTADQLTAKLMLLGSQLDEKLNEVKY